MASHCYHGDPKRKSNNTKTLEGKVVSWNKSHKLPDNRDSESFRPQVNGILDDVPVTAMTTIWKDFCTAKAENKELLTNIYILSQLGLGPLTRAWKEAEWGCGSRNWRWRQQKICGLSCRMFRPRCRRQTPKRCQWSARQSRTGCRLKNKQVRNLCVYSRPGDRVWP